MSLTNLIVILVQAGILVNMMLMAAAYMVLAERKIAAWIQNRVGPNRVGPWGLFQSFADVFKLYIKEDIVPAAADYKFHALAPVIAIGVAVTTYAIIPFSGPLIELDGVKYGLAMAPNMNIGILAVLAMTSVGVYGVALAGWSSNNKYSLMGGLRSAAQMISYELVMALTIMGLILVYGTVDLGAIVRQQSGVMLGVLPKWGVFMQPFAAFLFLTAAIAENKRIPFDLPEAESELVTGYYTEYSAMKMGLFMVSEFIQIAIVGALFTTLFLGGYNLPFMSDAGFLFPGGHTVALSHGLVVPLQMLGFLAKVFLMCVIQIQIRWSLPRFRYDQMLSFAWKMLLPLSLANLVVTAVAMWLLEGGQ